MRKLIYSIAVSLDGYINDAEGSLDFVRVDEEYHRFANQQQSETGLSIYGTHMWATMRYWDTVEYEQGHPEFMYEFARLWKPAAKLVASHTLTEADMLAGAHLFKGDLVAEVTRLKAEPGKPISVSGATIASSLIDAGLIDEIQPFIVPAITGGGTPFISAKHRADFDLIESRAFKSGMMFHRYGKR